MTKSILVNKHYEEIVNYKVRTYLTCYEMLNRLLSSSNQTIERREIIEGLEVNSTELQDRSIDKLVERQIMRFRKIFNLEREDFYYDRSLKKYKLVGSLYSSLPHHKVLYDYLSALVLSNKIYDSNLNYSKALLDDKLHQFKNSSILFMLIEAIVNKKTITFEHHNHFTNEVLHHEVEPWFIKLFEGNYYLGCYRKTRNHIKQEGYRHYTINQIVDGSLKILDKNIDVAFKENNFPEVEYSIFDQCIGIRDTKEANPSQLCIKDDIVIETDFTTGKNWINRPIHHKQICIKEAENYSDTFLFKLPKFYFNVSLKELVLKYHNKVTLISPQEAVNELKEDIKMLYSKYAY